MIHSEVSGMAGVHIAFAVDLLEIAENSFGQAVEALEEDEQETAFPDVAAMRSMCRVALALLTPAADMVRIPALGILAACRRSVLDREEDERNPPGLERAGSALAFVSSALDEAVSELDGGEWLDRCLAFAHVFNEMYSQIESSLVRRPPTGDPFAGMN